MSHFWAPYTYLMGSRRKKTDEIYRLGIARKAAPLERLKSRHHAFLERIMVSPTDTIPEDEPAMSLRTPGRSILGGVTSIPATLSGATQLAPANRLPKSTNGAKLDIFSDVTGQGDDAAPGEWADFGTRDGRRKENTVEAGPWKGETLPQSAARGRIAPRTPKVEVFRDSVRTRQSQGRLLANNERMTTKLFGQPTMSSLGQSSSSTRRNS